MAWLCGGCGDGQGDLPLDVAGLAVEVQSKGRARDLAVDLEGKGTT